MVEYMPNQTLKPFSDRDYPQTLKLSYNDVDASLSTAGFLVGKVGRKIVPTTSTTTVANDTVTYAYSENTIALYSIKCIYTDGTRTDLISAERIA